MKGKFPAAVLGAGVVTTTLGGLLVTRYGEGSHTYFAGPGILIVPLGVAFLLLGSILFVNRTSREEDPPGV